LCDITTHKPLTFAGLSPFHEFSALYKPGHPLLRPWQTVFFHKGKEQIVVWLKELKSNIML